MLTRKFRWEEDQDYGGYGWKPMWIPGFNITRDEPMAHDILEHLPGDTGEPHCELQALGALYYLRIETGYIYNRYRGTENPFEMTLHSFLDDVWRAQRSIKSAPRTYRLSEWSAGDTDGRLIKATQNAVKRLQADIEEEHYRYSEEDIAHRLPANMADNVIAWLRIGYRRAKRRYRHALQPCDLFGQIVRETARFKEAHEGEILTVSVNLRRQRVSVRTDSRYEDYQ